MTLQIDFPPELQQLLQQTAEREGTDLSSLVVRMVANQLPNPVDAHTPSAGMETALLHDINLGIPISTWERHHHLTEKRRLGTLLDPEREELIRITDQIEEVNAQRIEKLASLAKLRGTTVRALMSELGIPPGSYV